MQRVGDDDSDNEDMAGDARAAAAQAAYDRDRAARKARKAALAPVELAYEIDNTDAEQVCVAGNARRSLGTQKMLLLMKMPVIVPTRANTNALRWRSITVVCPKCSRYKAFRDCHAVVFLTPRSYSVIARRSSAHCSMKYGLLWVAGRQQARAQAVAVAHRP